jgi:hypothetical protein
MDAEIKVTVIATGFDQIWHPDGTKQITSNDALDLNTILNKSFDRRPSRPIKQEEAQLAPKKPQASTKKDEVAATQEEPLDVPTYFRFGKQERRKK